MDGMKEVVVGIRKKRDSRILGHSVLRLTPAAWL